VCNFFVRSVSRCRSSGGTYCAGAHFCDCLEQHLADVVFSGDGEADFAGPGLALDAWVARRQALQLRDGRGVRVGADHVAQDVDGEGASSRSRERVRFDVFTEPKMFPVTFLDFKPSLSLLYEVFSPSSSNSSFSSTSSISIELQELSILLAS
jgi:hypothetical protein